MLLGSQLIVAPQIGTVAVIWWITALPWRWEQLWLSWG
jgi:hypothetical protein